MAEVTEIGFRTGTEIGMKTIKIQENVENQYKEAKNHNKKTQKRTDKIVSLSGLPLLAGRCGGRGAGRNLGCLRCSQVQRDFRVGAGSARLPGGRGLGAPRTLSGRLAPPAVGSERLSTRASSCGGCTGSSNSDGPPAPRSNFRWASATSPRGKGAGLGTCSLPCWSPHPAPRPRPLPPAPVPCPPPPNRRLPRATPRGRAPPPATRHPVPSTAQRLRSAAARQRLAGSSARGRDALGKASWAPESGGYLENLLRLAGGL
ncbi:ubiquitin carboxyl-terminal hydrolase 51-like [Pan troglodytes]|uniref:ubiquitin carboxyl-terminal hydrolase 51-like n=1 Tax=Pan troglodytes TaxID=9598 RepID=UPI003013405E